MSNVTVIGSQWGDEGKGKVVDWLSARADVVVRFQGGHNAGHTLVIDEKVYKLHLLPSGIVRRGKISVIGNGVVVDPWALLSEIAEVRAQGVEITPDTLKIADNCNLIMPVHAAMDEALEAARGKEKLGTTKRGIGPTYEDKVARRGIRLCDLRDPELLKDKLDKLMVHHNALLKGLGANELCPAEIFEKLMGIADEVLAYATNVWRDLEQARRAGQKILFEGAQGVMLDVDHGTYPFVTSSNIVASQAASGAGVGPKTIGTVLGITKAYTTRVGTGPFPTEQENDDGQRMGERGHEFGTTTGRKRRCGWFDACMVRQAVTLAGIDGIVLTKLDVLDGFEDLKICTGYTLDGKEIDYFPAGQAEQSRVEPIYMSVPGWSESSFGARSFNDLPAGAVKYVNIIEELIGAPIYILSTSPEREDTILLKDPFVG